MSTACSRILPAGFVEPCIPTAARVPPSGPGWLHEIKHDGYRLVAPGRLTGAPIARFTGQEDCMFKVLVAATVLGIAVQASAQEFDKNIQVMVRAARSLTFLFNDNRAYMLEKQNVVLAESTGTVRGVASVAVIFGYADNRSACLEIAGALKVSLVGPFKCHPIY
jgi:hypothetical protein